MKSLIIFILASVIAFTNVSCKSETITPPPPPITVVYTDSILKVSEDGVFMRNGKPYRGIGINYFNAFYRTIQNQNDKSYYEGLKYLGDNKIPFVRVTFNGFWANELKLYQTNKARYFVLLDEFVKTAAKYRVGLVVSLNWTYFSIPDLMGEHVNQWGNPNSKTIAFMRTYTADIVSRYKDSPTIWAWEFCNEMNSYCDMLGQATNYLPKVSVEQGTPATRTIEDAITTNIFQFALNDFAATVRSIDPDRAISSGNGLASESMYHRYKYGNWTLDSSADFTQILDAHNPSAVGTLSIHPYPSQELKYFSDFTPKASVSQIIQEAMRSAKELKRPLYIGEFGSPKTLGSEMEAQKFNESLNAIIDNKVQLSSLWVFDFSPQDADWNITPTNSRKYQLDAIIKANAQFRVGQ